MRKHGRQIVATIILLVGWHVERETWDLDAISVNAANGVYDHDHVLRRGENYRRKSEQNINELFEDLFVKK